jgi:hypothetical protein
LCVLAEGGSLDTHVHSFEELFYILEGSPILVLEGHAVELAPGACGVVPVGVSHAWRGPERGGAKWIDMRTPIPREEGEPPDTFFLGKAPQTPAEPLDIRDPRNRHLFVMSKTTSTSKAAGIARQRADGLREHGHGAARP